MSGMQVSAIKRAMDHELKIRKAYEMGDLRRFTGTWAGFVI